MFFDANAVEASSSSSKFESGEFYPAIITGLFTASTEYQGVAKDGYLMTLLVEDEEHRLLHKTAPFLSIGLDPYNSKAAYNHLMNGLLGTQLEGSALRRAVIDAGLGDIRKLVGRPVSVRIVNKQTKKGSIFAKVEEVGRATERRKGLEESAIETGKVMPIDVIRMCGGFIRVPDVNDSVKVPWLQVTGSETKAEDEVDSVFKDAKDVQPF